MAAQSESLHASGRVARRQAFSRASRWVLLAASLVGVVVLLYIGYETVREGAGRLSWSFLTSYPSRKAELAGLRSSALGSAWVLGATVLLALPVAVGTAIWIEEFAPKNKLDNREAEPGKPGWGAEYHLRRARAGHLRALLRHGTGASWRERSRSLMIIPMTVIACRKRFGRSREHADGSWRLARRIGRQSGITCFPRRCRES